MENSDVCNGDYFTEFQCNFKNVQLYLTCNICNSYCLSNSFFISCGRMPQPEPDNNSSTSGESSSTDSAPRYYSSCSSVFYVMIYHWKKPLTKYIFKNIFIYNYSAHLKIPKIFGEGVGGVIRKY